MTMKRRLATALVTVAALTVAAAPAGAADNTIGSAGVGDPFFPQAGNGGIDVVDYHLDLAYDPAATRLTGTARLTVNATQDLSRFDLDLRGFTLGTVTVNGAAARVARSGQELVITPRRLLRKGARFTVVIPYSGRPQAITDPDGSTEGWVPTSDGAVVVDEPQGSPAWYPVNDTPRDKATYTVRMRVPHGLTAVGNGSLVGTPTTRRGQTTFTWRERFPMAPYLATITLGRFDVTRSRTPSGVPVYIAVDPRQASAASAVLRKLPQMVSTLEHLYGPYPFETVGAIVDDAPELGYSLETQTKPVFDQAPDEATLLHELSHMWFGDAVTLRTWPDIWLHEGFATWSEWIWTERQGGKSAAQQFEELASTPAQDTSFWNPPPGDPGEPALMFDGTVYDRGAMTLQALRERVGDRRFFTILRQWYSGHRYGTVETAQFVALAERVSGQDLTSFFDTWLYQPGKPAVLTDAAAAPATAVQKH
jgi:aminopeptidase N